MVDLFVCESIYLFVCLLVGLFVCLSIYLFVCLFVRHSVCMFVSVVCLLLFVCLLVGCSVCMFVYLFICLFDCFCMNIAINRHTDLLSHSPRCTSLLQSDVYRATNSNGSFLWKVRYLENGS